MKSQENFARAEVDAIRTLATITYSLRVEPELVASALAPIKDSYPSAAKVYL